MVRHLFCLRVPIVPTHHNPDQSSEGVVQLQALPTRFLPCTSLQSRPVRLLEHGTRLSSQILSAPTCQSHQSRVGSTDRPLPLPSQISVAGTQGSPQPNVVAQVFFSRSPLLHAASILIFLVLPVPLSGFCALEEASRYSLAQHPR